jgi:hypothetical protein
MAVSGTYAFNPRTSELATEIMERCDIRGSEVTVEHLLSCQRTMNFVLQSWSNLGVNLWTVQTFTQILSQGVATYDLPAYTIDVLPDSVYLRQYSMQGAVDVTPNFATTISTATITATQANHGYAANGFVNIIVPVAVGGLILSGIYQIASVPSANTYTFTAASNATSSATGGAVPVFTTTASSTSVNVLLTAHGYLAGQSFEVEVATDVGGITLTGTYTIATIVDANSFTITSEQTAGSTATASENDGDTQISGSSTSTTAAYTDRIMAPISRGDYAAQPNKLAQGFPTTYWVDRLINPTITLWEVPDQNGPYVLYMDCTTQIQDVSGQGTETIQLPPRFLEAFVAAGAANYAMKWNTAKAEALAVYSDKKWLEASNADTERVTTQIIPELSGYWRP